MNIIDKTRAGIQGIIDGIGKLVSREKREGVETTSTGYTISNPLMARTLIGMASKGKSQIIKDCKTMWEGRGQNSAITQTISTYLTKGGFQIMVKPKEKELSKDEAQAQTIIDAVKQRTNLELLLKGWATALPRDGMLAVEIEIGNNQIIRLVKLAAEITIKEVDDKGRNYADGGQVDANKAYSQTDTLTGQKICQLADWQIMWIDWNPIQGEGGSPQFKSARKIHKQVEDSEDNQWIRRKINAGQRHHHKIGSEDNPGKTEDIEQYKILNQDSLNNPLSVSSDYFSNGRVTIDTLSGDSNISSIEDIRYQEGQYFGVGGVPLSFIPGQEGSVIRKSAEQSADAFVSWVQDCNEMIGACLKKSIFDLELLLNGINPESINYNITWSEKIKTNDMEKKRQIISAKTAGIYSIETAMREYGIADPEMEKERIRKDMEEFPLVPVISTQGYQVGDNPLGLTGALRPAGMGFGERRQQNEEKLMFIAAMNEIRNSVKEMLKK